MFSLAGKTALVSGAAQGIGRGIAEILAEAGAHVFLCDVDDEKGQLAAEAISAAGRRASYIHADVSQSSHVERVTSDAVQQTGRIDVVCCNAAYTVGNQSDLLNGTDEEWQANIQVSLLGSRNLIRSALPAMLRQQSGSIIVISSTQAIAACPGTAAYTSVKAAQLGLVRSVAADYGKYNIRSNGICPGPITVRYSPEIGSEGHQFQISHTALGRRGEPRDIGYAALFLASDEAAYVTGAVLPVDGGWTAL